MLDFNSLNNDLTKCPTRAANEAGHINIPAEYKAQPAGVTGPEYKEDREKANEMSLLEVSKLINERLGRCELAIWAYNKAVRDGRPPEEIALLAAKALSLAVSEELIYKSLEKALGPKYGIRVNAAPPYEITRE